MNAIAAVVLGGTSLMGGRGGVGGTIIGAFVIGVLADGLILMGVSEFWQIVVKGLVIVLAVILDQMQQRYTPRAAAALRIRAIERAIVLKNQYNVRIINLSLGRPVMESYTLGPLCKAVESAASAGILVVVAAGNEGRNNSAGTNGYGTIGSPGNHPLALTAGTMKTMSTPNRDDDLIASYSSKSPTLIDQVV